MDSWTHTDHWRLNVFAIEQVAVFGHVARRIHEILHVSEHALIFAGQFLPRHLEARNGAVAQAGNDVEHGVEVFALFALTCATGLINKQTEIHLKTIRSQQIKFGFG